MADKVTSLQVAQRAGVSQSAVSRVFTPGASVSQKTADKVKKAAAELGYRPNVLARAMVSGRSRIIGLVVAYLENQFYPEAMTALSARLQEEGYHILIFMSQFNADNTDQVLNDILSYQVDGIILASVGMSADVTRRCEELGIPVLLFNRSDEGGRQCAVTSDNLLGGRRAAQHLLALGHRRIGYIAGWEGASTQRDRERGFTEALAEQGVALAARDCGNFSQEEAAAATRRMFATPDHPEAVFVANDHMAFAVLDTLRHDLGLRVPEDVSVIGFDDVGAAAWPSYNLTTVRQPARRMAQEAVTILLEQIDARADGSARQPRQVTFEGPLIERGTTRERERQS